MIVIDPKTKRIVWQYGHTGTPGRAPGYLNKPDGLDLLPSAFAARRVVQRASPAARSHEQLSVRRIGTLPSRSRSPQRSLAGRPATRARRHRLGRNPRRDAVPPADDRPSADGHARRRGRPARPVRSSLRRWGDLVRPDRRPSRPGERRGAHNPPAGRAALRPRSRDRRGQDVPRRRLYGRAICERHPPRRLRRSHHNRRAPARGLRYAGIATLGGKIYVAGGVTTNGESSAVYAFDPATGTVRRVARLPTPEAHAALAALGGSLYLAGGRSVLRIDPVHGSVGRAASLPQALTDPNAVALGGRLVLVGGGTSAVYELVPHRPPGSH